jgi:hypothetical protein
LGSRVTWMRSMGELFSWQIRPDSRGESALH